MSQKQQTLNGPLSFQGKGLHTGLNVQMTFLPAEAGSGIRFRRTDLEGAPEVEALADYVVDTSRGTTIERKDVRVSTIEHVMAALWSCGVDNAVVEVDAPETPIMDGSAREYAEAIASVGLQEQDADRVYYDINEKTCRTFVFLHEIEQLLQHNLIKGGDLDNAIVIVERDITPEELERLSKLCNKADIKVTKGYLNNLKLRFPNECARHKLLDVLGDLALIGVRIRGSIVANKPGHFANTEFAKLVRKNIKRDSVRPSYRYNPTTEPEYDRNQIRSMLPHRPPFLLVDKVMHVDSEHVIGIKNVTMNEPFFVGHFPQEPVMPGVLIIEAMAQCGGILALHDIPDPENYSTYFMKIDGVKFRGKVVPGDTLQFELRLVEPIRRGIVLMEAKAFVGDQLKTEALMMAQVARNKA